MLKPRWFALGVTLVLGCSHARRPQEVALAFAWPETAHAQVERQVEKGRQETAPVRFTMHYQLDSHSKDGERQVAYSQVRFEPALPAEVEAAVRPGFELTHVLDARGEVQRVEGVERAFAAALKMPAVAQSTPEQLAQLRELGAQAALQEARDLWGALVGNWAGRALEPGREVQVESDGTMPLAPGVAVPMQQRYALKRWVPCEEGGTATCVELWLRSEPDPAAMGEALRTFFQQAEARGGKPLRVPEGVQVGIVTETLVVTEPNTLIPHRLTVHKTVRMPDLDSAEPRVLQQDEVHDYRFRFGPLPSKRSGGALATP